MRVRVMLIRDRRARSDGLVLDTPEAAFRFLRPKLQRLETTRRIKSAGALLGIPLIDHVIVGGGKTFYSFRQSGSLEGP